MRLNQLAYLIAIVETGSIREAARRAGVSSPALTKGIKALEAELSVELIRRSPRGAVPTSVGKAFCERARAIQAELRNARDEIAWMMGVESGKVSFGISQASGALIVPSSLERFRRDWPKVEVRIVEGLPEALLPRLRDRSLDFFFGARITALDTSISFKPLFRTPRVIVARKDHPLIEAKSVVELAHANWVVVPPLGRFDPPIAKLLEASGSTASATIVRCESYHIAIAIVARSDFLAVMAKRQLTEPTAINNLASIQVVERLSPITVGAYYRADAPMTPAAKALMSTLSSFARRLASAHAE